MGKCGITRIERDSEKEFYFQLEWLEMKRLRVCLLKSKSWPFGQDFVISLKYGYRLYFFLLHKVIAILA